MPELADRVYETTISTGTGAVSLGGAVTGYQTFVSGVGDGNSCAYVISDGTDWEVGVGTVTAGSPDTLSRDTVKASSNGGAAVDWGAGEKDVFNDLLAYRMLELTAHIASEANPHNTDYSQTGAAPAAQGVTNGDSHDHSGGDGGQIAHSSLSDIGTDDHHSKYTDAEAQAAINADTDHSSTASHSHNDLSDIGTDDHHSRYTDAEAQTAINNDADHGSTAAHNYFSGDHADLTNVNADDHHSRYTDSEAITAINSDADHSSTAAHSHDDLSDVGAADHHSRYTDSEAVSAANAETALSVVPYTRDSGILRFSFPAGAACDKTGVTGAIKITLPVALGSKGMFHAVLRVYEWTDNESFTVHFGGYTDESNFSGGFAYILGERSVDRNFTVRFGDDGSNACVFIGETDTDWNYVQAAITDVVVGWHGNAAADWVSGWDLSIVTSFPTIYQTVTNTQVGSDAQAVSAIESAHVVQDNGYTFATDQVKARNSGGLRLTDDGSYGMVVEDGGDVTFDGDINGNTVNAEVQVNASQVNTSQVKALDSNGLQLTDDADNGMTVEDGGNVTFAENVQVLGGKTEIHTGHNNYYGYEEFYRGDGGRGGYIGYGNGADEFNFKLDAASLLKIQGCNVSIDDGGIYLGGTAAANLLDDYEEGTWTPVLGGDSTAGDFSYSSQAGYYTKVGNFVYLEFQLEVSAVNSAADGKMFIAGIPFNAASTVQNVVSFAPATRLDSYPTDYSGLVGRVWSDGSGIQLGYFKKESATEFNLDDSYVGTSTRLRGAAWYRV